MVFSIAYRNKINWKRFTQEFSKMFDSERNKQQQRVLCNEICRLPNETIKQLAVRIETLVRKAYSLNTHDYKNTKMTEILMMTLTPQLRKIAIKKRASHPSSNSRTRFRFSKTSRQTRTSRNHNETRKNLSKNGVIIADDTDIVFLNVDKNSKTIKINLKNIKNQIIHSINT